MAETRAQRLWDEHEVGRLEPLYCRAIDRLDLELLTGLFHPDATEIRGGAPRTVADAAPEILAALRETFAATFHTVTQSVAQVRGAAAVSESYYLSRVVVRSDPAVRVRVFGPERAAGFAAAAGTAPLVILSGGRYVSRCEKRAGVWKFARRQVVNEWNHCARSAEFYGGGMLGAIRRDAARDLADPLYAALAELDTPSPAPDI